MRRFPPLIVALSAFALGAASTLLYVRTRAPAAPAAAEKDGRQVLYWYDPMAPQQHFDKPGKSPYMDMPLVPKYANGDGASAPASTVQIDPRQAQSLGVRSAKVERGTLARDVRATGTLAFDERAVTVVQSRVAGIVEKLSVRAPLTPVRRGEPLLTLTAPDWTAAQEEYLALRRARAPGLDAMRTAARQRLALIGMDEAQIRAVERSGHAQTRITIAAPRDGVIADLTVRDGASVAAGAPLMTINGLDDVWLVAAIAEADSGRVQAGAAVAATLPAFPGETFAGTVESLLPELDPATRTQQARIVLSNPQRRLAPGMFASVDIAQPAAAAAQLLVPSEAVIATGERTLVIVDGGNGHFHAQEVRVGVEAGGRSAVLDGLREGERVVLSGQFLIDSEASLSGALARLEAGTKPAAERAVANPDAAPEQYAATGVVEGIDGRRWTIATDPVPSLEMGAMTMTFVGPQEAPGIRSGERVRLRFFRNAEGRFEIAAIERDASAEQKP